MSVLRNDSRFSLIASPELDTWQEFREDVRAGLTGDHKQLSCRYLYDERGSQLFDKICDQREYYLTRVETSILKRIAPELASRFDRSPQLVELGSGRAAKTRILIKALIAEHGSLLFEPIDISRSALVSGCEELLGEFAELEVRAIAAEYIPGLRLLARDGGSREAPRLVVWLGSSIGNFHRPDAAAFLAELGQELRPGDRLLVGIDMRKSPALLEAAYDDAAGVTAEFLKNLLVRINGELGGNFDLQGFRYVSRYDEQIGRVEMALVSQRACRVRLPELGLELDLAQGEPIHIENSYKYSPEEVLNLAREADLRILGQWDDGSDRFREVLLAAQERGGQDRRTNKA